jgi:hypothetical protein
VPGIETEAGQGCSSLTQAGEGGSAVGQQTQARQRGSSLSQSGFILVILIVSCAHIPLPPAAGRCLLLLVVVSDDVQKVVAIFVIGRPLGIEQLTYARHGGYTAVQTGGEKSADLVRREIVALQADVIAIVDLCVTDDPCLTCTHTSLVVHVYLKK